MIRGWGGAGVGRVLVMAVVGLGGEGALQAVVAGTIKEAGSKYSCACLKVESRRGNGSCSGRYWSIAGRYWSIAGRYWSIVGRYWSIVGAVPVL